MKTYNKSEIMKAAWVHVRKGGLTLKMALKTAWAYAKLGTEQIWFPNGQYKGDENRAAQSPVRKHNGLTALAASLVR